MGHTITVYSTRGGSGKTITSLSIAKTLATRGYKTVLIDVDIEAPSLVHLIPPPEDLDSMRYWTEYLDNPNLNMEDVIFNCKINNLSIIYSNTPEMGKHFLQTKQRSWWESALKRELLAQQELYRMGYDFIILDNQSGTSMNSVNNMILEDTSVLVVRPANYGADATESFIDEMYRVLKGIKPRNDFYIWNQVIKTENEDEEKILRDFLERYNPRIKKSGLTLGCEIPFDRVLNLRLLTSPENYVFDLPEDIQKPIDQLIDTLLEKAGL